MRVFTAEPPRLYSVGWYNSGSVMRWLALFCRRICFWENKSELFLFFLKAEMCFLSSIHPHRRWWRESNLRVHTQVIVNLMVARSCLNLLLIFPDCFRPSPLLKRGGGGKHSCHRFTSNESTIQLHWTQLSKTINQSCFSLYLSLASQHRTIWKLHATIIQHIRVSQYYPDIH